MKRIIALTILFLSAFCVYAQHCPSGSVPIQGGGTCATTAAGALANLGGAALSGAAFTGPVRAPFYTTTELLPVGYSSVAGWGDSLTLGNEGAPIPTQSTWLIQLAGLTGLNTYNAGVGGQGSAQILARYLADISHRNWITVFEMGTNDGNEGTPFGDTLANNESAVAAVPTGVPYIVTPPILNILNPTGSAQYIAQQALLSQEASTFGTHFIDTWTPLFSAGAGGACNSPRSIDVYHCSHQQVPTTERALYQTGVATGQYLYSPVTSTTACDPADGGIDNRYSLPAPYEMIILDAATNSQEDILVTATSGSSYPYTITAGGCTRGYAGTTATTHAANVGFDVRDLIHLNEIGYALWASLFQAWLQQYDNASVDIADLGPMVTNQFPILLADGLASPPAPYGSITPEPAYVTQLLSTEYGYTAVYGSVNMTFNIAGSPVNLENLGTNGGIGFFTNGRAIGTASNSNLMLNADQTSSFYGNVQGSGSFQGTELVASSGGHSAALYPYSLLMNGGSNGTYIQNTGSGGIGLVTNNRSQSSSTSNIFLNTDLSSNFNGALKMTYSGIPTSLQNYGSEPIQLYGLYYNSGIQWDTWTTELDMGTGTSPTSTVSYVHTGSPGKAAVSVPNLIVNGAISGVTTATNSDNRGHITLVAGTGSYTFTQGPGVGGIWTTAPACTIQDDTTLANIGTSTKTVTNVALTITGSVGTADTYTYICWPGN